MARKRFTQKRRSPRRVASVRRAKSSGTKMLNRPSVQGLLYGLARQPISGVINQVAGSIPVLNNFTGQSDELLLWLSGTVASNMSGGNSGIKKFAKTMQTVEAQNIGQTINVGGFGNIFGGSAATPAVTETATTGANF